MEPADIALSIWASGEHPRITIDPERVALLCRAADVMSVVLGLEEKLELVVANFEEFERELFNLSHRSLTRRDFEWATMSADRLLLNRRLANLLSACRMYIDHGKHDLGHSSLPDGLRDAFKIRLSAEYDRVLGYRVMEALRNHIQHKNIPTKGIAFPSHRDENESGAVSWSFSVLLKLDLEELAADKFKATVLQEIRNRPHEDRDVVFWVREYVESIGKVHEEMREQLHDSITEADRAFAEAIDEWKQLSNSITGLSVISFLPDGTARNLVPITENLSQRRDALARANRIFQGLAYRYVNGDRPARAYRT
jgi:hypothetical protein